MRRSLLLLPFMLAVAVLAGCGQKGPLVLPPTKAAPAAGTLTVPAPPSSSVMPASAQS